MDNQDCTEKNTCLILEVMCLSSFEFEAISMFFFRILKILFVCNVVFIAQ